MKLTREKVPELNKHNGCLDTDSGKVFVGFFTTGVDGDEFTGYVKLMEPDAKKDYLRFSLSSFNGGNIVLTQPVVVPAHVLAELNDSRGKLEADSGKEYVGFAGRMHDDGAFHGEVRFTNPTDATKGRFSLSRLLAKKPKKPKDKDGDSEADDKDKEKETVEWRRRTIFKKPEELGADDA